MAITTYSSISSFVSTIYEGSLLVVRESNLMANLVSNYSAQGWMTRQFSVRPQVTPATVSDGVDYSNPTTFGKSSVGTLTPSEVIAQILLTDQNIESDPDGARTQAAAELGEAIASKVDTDLCSAFSSFSSDLGDGANTTATLSNFAAAVANLRGAKAPMRGLVAVLHPYHWHDIWVELGTPAATYPSLDDVTSEVLRNYYMTRLLMVPIYTTANIAVDASDDAISGIFHQRALALDTRRPYRLEPERDASLRAWELNATIGYAYGLGDRPTWGIKFTADATAPA